MPSVFYLDCDFFVDDLELDLEDQDMSFGIDFGVVTERDRDHDYYEGPYEVTPQIYAQELATEQRIARENIEVKEIPKFEVSNKKGTTVYIGATLNG